MPRVTKPKLKPYEKAHVVGRWAEILFRALSNRVAKRWKFVSFRGTHGGESRGIVDVLAIRKDFRKPPTSYLKRGDLFEIVLVQLKGGKARRPSDKELARLQCVASLYGDAKVVLFEWRKIEAGRAKSCKLSILIDGRWKETTDTDVFG